MDLLRILWLLAAGLGALFAAIGIAGKVSRKVSASAVDRFYYAGYGFMVLSVLLFILHGFLTARG